MAIQPILQPGTTHPLDMDPSVITGAIDAKIPMGIKGLSPYTTCLYTSSDITTIPSFLAISAT